MDLIAHKTEDGLEQTLSEHLKNVAERSAFFAESFCNADWAYFAGMLHDLGKADSDWQKYIRGEKSTSVNHSEAGAQFAYSKMDSRDFFSKVIPYLIAGHHAGLPDWHEGSGNSLKSILEKSDISYLEKLLSNSKLKENVESFFPKSMPFGKNDLKKDNPQKLLEHFHLWIRMLYSCLVDADFLDTEQFMQPEQSELRGIYASLEELKRRFDVFMAEKTKSARPSKINEIRSSILESCREKGKLEPGFFSLNVPTGGGKTLSSMAFALEHALAHQKKRIIMAIPYTSIIEQTAKVYKYGTDNDDEIEEFKKSGKCLFGEENVLEHHCNFDFDKDDENGILVKQKLATENWDAPIIVTTNVQLFESLFNAHSSSCRKLHNLVDSVIILDEAQMLPPEYLKSILSVLRGLVKCFGVTVVFCTATQPALEGKIGSDVASFDGVPADSITPIIDNPATLAEQLKRVEINTEYAKEKMTDWQTVADKLCEFEQVLCIVQTRKDCRELHRLMPAGTIHLSALMCAEERSDVIAEIKERLRDGKTCRVISTQLVECGVDIDFPVVFRAIAGLDSVAQSAGRCNREGKIECGTVYLFNPPANVPSGLLRKGAEVTKELLELHDYTLSLTPDLYKEYFTKYYKSLNDFDKCEFENLMQAYKANVRKNRDGCLQFRTLSDNYHLIDNAYQATVYVRYCSSRTGKDNINLLTALEVCEIDKSLFRKLNRYSVNLPLKEIKELVKEGRVLEPIDGVFMQSLDDANLYQAGLGLVADSVKSFETY
ncbi:CRISPR-associated endonuclease Cas3'', partial [Treponema saccharophilum]|uniref:CRISPR-associated endonuclease Cas3'' n=1 Tax=Treponema saccharophilum TaxID=165 RepID=UPI00386D7853